MIDRLDFKNYLNHNEVNLESSLDFNTLHFTLNSETQKMRSYFGYSQYNGDLAYFDREFTESYEHIENALGCCDNDEKDEMLSFIYSLVTTSSSDKLYTIKVSRDYIINEFKQSQPENNPDLEGGESGDNNENQENTQETKSNVQLFIEKIKNVFVCLNTTLDVSYTDEDDNITEAETIDQINSIKNIYLSFASSDDPSKYTIKFDIANLQEWANENATTCENFIIYVTFSVYSKN